MSAGFGTIAEAFSGFAHITGEADGPPTLPPFGLADGIAALTTAFAIMTALRARELTGRGQVIDMAIIEPASQGDANRGESTFDIIEKGLGKLSIPLEMGSKDLAGGILKVKECLRSRNGQSSLFVTRSCERSLYEFGRYVWDEWSRFWTPRDWVNCGR